MIQYSIEHLYHFNCKQCLKWWTIADFQVIGNDELTCPHCRVTSQITELSSGTTMTTFTRKGYGRIYVTKPEHIAIVDNIIRQMNEYEHSYMNKEFITTFDNYPQVVYTGKFDELNIDDLVAICMSIDIPVFCFDAYNNQMPMSFTTKYDNLNLSFKEAEGVESHE